LVGCGGGSPAATTVTGSAVTTAAGSSTPSTTTVATAASSAAAATVTPVPQGGGTDGACQQFTAAYVNFISASKTQQPAIADSDFDTAIKGIVASNAGASAKLITDLNTVDSDVRTGGSPSGQDIKLVATDCGTQLATPPPGP
jgi:hypothetical protein